MKNYIVYIHKNKINGKVYVGITSQKPNQRWRNGTNYYGNEHFHRAIKKYGWENFDHIIVLKDIEKSEAEKKEVELIQKYKSYQREFGYNIQLGGSSKGKHSSETIKKISESQKGEKNHMYGKRGRLSCFSRKVIRMNDLKIYDSAKEANLLTNIKTNISVCCNGKINYAGKYKNGEPMIWMWLDDYNKLEASEREEYLTTIKNKIQNCRTRKNNSRARKIKCIETNEEFDCIKDACEKYQISQSNVSQCLNGYIKQCTSKKLNKKMRFVFL